MLCPPLARSAPRPVSGVTHYGALNSTSRRLPSGRGTRYQTGRFPLQHAFLPDPAPIVPYCLRPRTSGAWRARRGSGRALFWRWATNQTEVGPGGSASRLGPRRSLQNSLKCMSRMERSKRLDTAGYNSRLDQFGGVGPPPGSQLIEPVAPELPARGCRPDAKSPSAEGTRMPSKRTRPLPAAARIPAEIHQVGSAGRAAVQRPRGVACPAGPPPRSAPRRKRINVEHGERTGPPQCRRPRPARIPLRLRPPRNRKTARADTQLLESARSKSAANWPTAAPAVRQHSSISSSVKSEDQWPNTALRD